MLSVINNQLRPKTLTSCVCDRQSRAGTAFDDSSEIDGDADNCGMKGSCRFRRRVQVLANVKADLAR